MKMICITENEGDIYINSDMIESVFYDPELDKTVIRTLKNDYFVSEKVNDCAALIERCINDKGANIRNG